MKYSERLKEMNERMDKVSFNDKMHSLAYIFGALNSQIEHAEENNKRTIKVDEILRIIDEAVEHVGKGKVGIGNG